MPATAEEVAAINLLRSMQHRPPLAPHELEAFACDPPPAQIDVSGMSEAEALAWLDARQHQAADQPPAAPAPAAPPPPASRPHQVPAAAPASGAPAVDPAALAAAGYPGPLTDRERRELGQMAPEYAEDGRPPLTATKAAELVVTWRRRVA